MCLIVVGLAMGIILYGLRGSLSTTTSTTTSTSSEGGITPSRGGGLVNRLRAGGAAKPKTTGSLPKVRPRSNSIDIAGTELAERKAKFLQYQPTQMGTAAFPYYPNNNNKESLVEETHDFSTFRAPGGSRFEEWIHGDTPYSYQLGESDDLARSRRYHVKKAMQFAWAGYEQYAFGMDEIKPETMQGANGWGGFGTTLVDSLDTLWLMDMKDEFQRARDWVRDSLSHNRNRMVSFFETTIRSLGGLLSGKIDGKDCARPTTTTTSYPIFYFHSHKQQNNYIFVAYDWSGDEVFLEQAHDLGNRLFQAIEKNELGIAFGQVNLATGDVHNIPWTGGNSITAEFGTVQLEFRLLARLTGNMDFKIKSERMFEILKEMDPPHGLYPNMVKNLGDKPEFGNQKLTFGAMGDSFYEYMLKLWLQGGKKEDIYREMYDHSIQGMHDELLQLSSPSGLVYIADKNNGHLDTKMDHLVCFMGGLLALGAYTDPLGLESERGQRDLKTGKALTYTCYQMYARMPTGISPEYIQFHEDKDFEIGRGAPHYLLRPETVESFFILYHLTGDPVYREWGWEVFQAIERYCKTNAGYGQLKDVRKLSAPAEDKTESFFFAETMKYLYLLFDPDTPIDLLNKHVFNTEAHPVRIFPAMDAAGVKDLLK